MKKISLVVMMLVALFGHGQSGKFISAWNYKESYKKGDGVQNLEDAKRVIDEALTDPAAQAMTKGWWYRFDIYFLLSVEPSLKGKYPGAALEALSSLIKMRDLNDPKFKNWEDAIASAKNLGNEIFNEGVDAFKAKDYATAYKNFMAIADLNGLIESKGEKSAVPLDKSLENASYAAENMGDKRMAADVYKKLIATYPDAKYYHLLSVYERDMKNEGEANRIVDEGLAKYPSSKELLIDKYNSFPEDKRKDAIDYLKRILANDPKNEAVMGALAGAYVQQKDITTASQMYNDLLAMYPNNFEANFNMGVLIFNQAKEQYWDKMNALGISAADKKLYDEYKIKRDELFIKSKVYFEKARTINPNDKQLNAVIDKIDSNLK
ncbi:MAG: tetratricopeptide repeat protein [Chitinophagales bacterium]